MFSVLDLNIVGKGQREQTKCTGSLFSLLADEAGREYEAEIVFQNRQDFRKVSGVLAPQGEAKALRTRP